MEKQKRLFTALRFPPETIKQIAVIQEKLKAIDPNARYVTPLSNFHLTLYFIGMVEQKDIILADDALKAACAKYREEVGKPFELVFNRLGSFKSKSGKLAWLGIEENDDVRKLAELIREEIKDRDFIKVDDKRFRAHITLARQYRGELPEEISPPSPIVVDQATLVWSHRNASNVLLYDNLVSYPVIEKKD